MADLETPARDENYTATGSALWRLHCGEQKRSLVELRHQRRRSGNPWVVARDQSGHHSTFGRARPGFRTTAFPDYRFSSKAAIFKGAVLWSTFEYSSGRAGLTGIGARMEDGPGQSEEER
jgi:hypothetical protein